MTDELRRAFDDTVAGEPPLSGTMPATGRSSSRSATTATGARGDAADHQPVMATADVVAHS
jgi:hypothetical protein